MDDSYFRYPKALRDTDIEEFGLEAVLAYERGEPIEKFNPYHDKIGRFTNAENAANGGAATAVAEEDARTSPGAATLKADWPETEPAGGFDRYNQASLARAIERKLGMARDTVAVDRKRPETYRLIGDASVPVPNDADEQMARAAWQAAEVLARMKAEGYGLPDSLVIGLNSRIDSQRPSGEVTQTGGAEVRRANLILRVPRLLPLGVSLNEAIAIANKKTAIASVSGAKRLYVGQSFEDTVVHEMGHVQHERTLWAARGRGIDSDDVTPFPLAQKTPFEVSTYAGVNPAEFVAETFTALYRGESFSPAVMNLYRALHGPQVRNYPARQAAYERRRRAVYDEVIDAWIAERKQ